MGLMGKAVRAWCRGLLNGIAYMEVFHFGFYLQVFFRVADHSHNVVLILLEHVGLYGAHVRDEVVLEHEFPDVVPLQSHFDLIQRLTGARSIGMVYTSGEANGISLMEGMKAVAEENGVEFIAASVATSAEVKVAAASIIDRVDAMYVATDNTVVSAISALSDVCASAGVPLFSADTTSAEQADVLIAGGFDYYASGRLTGEIVMRLLSGESPADIGTAYLEDLELYVNNDAADRLGITIPDDILENAAVLIENGENIKAE